MNYEILIVVVLFAVVGIWVISYKKIGKTDNKTAEEKSQEYWSGIGMSIGMLLGYALAFLVFWLLGQKATAVPVGVALGVGFGTGLGAYLKKKNADKIISEEKFRKFQQTMMIAVLLGVLSLAAGLFVFTKMK